MFWSACIVSGWVVGGRGSVGLIRRTRGRWTAGGDRVKERPPAPLLVSERESGGSGKEGGRYRQRTSLTTTNAEKSPLDQRTFLCESRSVPTEPRSVPPSSCRPDGEQRGGWSGSLDEMRRAMSVKTEDRRTRRRSRTDDIRSPHGHSVYLAVSWEEIQENGGVRTVGAYLCRAHRGDVSLKYATARGSGRLGDSCDLCEGRQPRTISGV
jgi:hypothetical protein